MRRSVEFKEIEGLPSFDNRRIVHEPVKINATDAALIMDMLRRVVRPLSDRYWMLEVLRIGSNEFRI
jgi:hypothetical protein